MPVDLEEHLRTLRHDARLLKARHKLAKIPTSAILEQEHRAKGPIYADYLEKKKLKCVLR